MVVKRSNDLPAPKPSDVANALGIKTISIDWLAGDGSDRCYYRLTSVELRDSLVLMQLSGNDAQALRNNGYDWIKIADILVSRGIPVPRVVTPIPEHAALVIEDYGDVMLEGRIFELADKNDSEIARDLYRQAAGIACQFLTIPRTQGGVWCNRAFDAERFVWELNFFVQKYATSIAGINFSAGEKSTFDAEARSLSETLARHSKYFVHRDYHSRNIMVKNHRLAIIDFQDARLGPPAYDFVSLFFDSYVPFKGKQRREMLEEGIAQVDEKCGDSIACEIQETWKPTLLQRQLKAIGSFGFLTRDKQRGNYLRYVAPALSTLEEQEVYDQRWPFISGELPQKMRHFLGTAL